LISVFKVNVNIFCPLVLTTPKEFLNTKKIFKTRKVDLISQTWNKNYILLFRKEEKNRTTCITSYFIIYLFQYSKFIRPQSFVHTFFCWLNFVCYQISLMKLKEHLIFLYVSCKLTVLNIMFAIVTRVGSWLLLI
jgi:hypothetical protein